MVQFGLTDEIIWDVPEVHVPIVASSDQSELSLLELILYLLLGRQPVEQHRPSVSSSALQVTAELAGSAMSPHFLGAGLVCFRRHTAVVGFRRMLSTPLHCAFDFLFHIEYHLLLFLRISPLCVVLL